ncbi:NAD-dependent dehydratase [Candidatus Cerribacteria bacterium 'Amazon FNV 2010 28 9']|uniref:NAD-dependent dehydratase n=1 Tax=Candidatus Cerribacteria bacterium 'Amazon FNV 2010 28 9' TaxID=2081795 RepID=A0A317JPK1_9BACT|nr:MAG: NAD-dependent dehydratase [Candidatus Cerribacteria bacterium 'Amazon FNV 2010 28 9']
MHSFYQGKTILVTGAAGFIASHLIDQLLESGANVVGVDNFLTGRKENIEHLKTHEHFHFIEADVIDYPDSYLSTTDYQLPTINCLFHLASPASPVGYQAHPVETYMVNAFATHQLLQYLLINNPQARFLFTSTSEIYGDPLEHPQKETYWGNVNPNGPRSMYDEAKRLGETICGVHARDFGMDVRIVRIFNTYGPRMDLRDGRVLPGFFLNVLEQKPIEIHGDGTQTRSFCYVSDLVEGLLQMMEKGDFAGETVNLGNPSEITMNELALLVNEVADVHQTPTHITPRPEDPKQRKPDITKAQTMLGFKPIVGLKEGLQSTLEYFKTQV